ncbi:MAG TPA: DNA-3-methyladenine glycosylase I [Jiangellales bacterium]|nr:DNA-3-methyladenine glycosylase I [Jiangellales bacterium]
MTEAVTGEDGRARCPWAVSTPDYLAYHDDEWGRPVHGDRALYERLTLEAFQSGLSWLTILRKREGFRSAFAGFDPDAVAAFGPSDVERLLLDPAIVRNRAKVEAAVANARALVALREAHGEGALDTLVWSHAPDPASRPQPRSMADLPATTPQSTALARALKRAGFRFVGPTTAYATMQACGVVDDHLVGCWRRMS